MGLGRMRMNCSYGPAADTQEMMSLTRDTVELGVTFFSTAAVYGACTNEEPVGEAAGSPGPGGAALPTMVPAHQRSSGVKEAK
jgi:aryl-alcohol dehydrogenase-like predicted oxidoreductase